MLHNLIMSNAEHAFESSTLLKSAMEATVEFCVAEDITDQATVMEIMDRTVRRMHADLVKFADRFYSDSEFRAAVTDGVLRVVWTEIREEAGLPVENVQNSIHN